MKFGRLVLVAGLRHDTRTQPPKAPSEQTDDGATTKRFGLLYATPPAGRRS